MNRSLRPALVLGITSIVFGGAIFGFFYAWICSTMWGLDAIDPRTAIAAMQGMNASVRNWVFFPAFFLTPLVMWSAAVFAVRARARRSALVLGIAGLLYLVGGIVLTQTVNVQMNVALAEVVIPADIETAARIWNDYSGRWQVFNVIRTVVSGASLVLAAVALTGLAKAQGQRPVAAAG